MTRQIRQYDRDVAKESLRGMSSVQYKNMFVNKTDSQSAKIYQNAQNFKSESTVRKIKSEIYAEDDNNVDDILDID